MSEGLQLLAQAFPELLDNGGGYVGERNPAHDPRESTKAIRKVPEFEIEDFPTELEGEFRGVGSLTPAQVRDLPFKQVHTLAWYQPYRFYGKREWGIYFHLNRMTEYCEQVAQLVLATRTDIARHQVYNTVWQMVARHEVEHAVQELALAQAVIESGANPYHFPRPADPKLNLEALATSFEFYDYQQTAGAGTYGHGYTASLARQIPLPAGYADWQVTDVAAAEEELAHRLGGASPELCTKFRNALQSKAKSKFLSIPLRVVEEVSASFDSSAVWARAYGFDCKKVQKALAKEKVLAKLHPDLVARKGSSHELVLNMGSKPGTVPVSCHGFDLVHNDLLRQIAELTNKPKADVQSVLRAAI